MNFKRFVPLIVLVVLFGAQYADRSDAQNVIVLTPSQAKSAGGAVTADDTDVAMLIKYVGTNAAGGSVAVTSATDLTFLVGGSADTTFECPVSGALGGIIDVTNAACNTLGEVCDAINGVNGAGGAGAPGSSTGTDFRCVIIDGLRSDSTSTTLLTLTNTLANGKDGLEINWDTTAIKKMTRAVLPPEARKIGFYLGPAGAGYTSGGYQLRPFPFKNTRTYVTWAWEDTGTCTGADTFRVVAANDYTFGSETEQILYGPLATNTTTPVEFSNLSNSPVFSQFGAKVIAREGCASSMAAGLVSVAGYQIENLGQSQ